MAGRARDRQAANLYEALTVRRMLQSRFRAAPPRGTMRALVRAMDWSKTPLGPMQAWPQSLKTAVDLCLDSPVAMIVLWGPELVQIYNDGYAAIAGAKHPTALGQRTRECWPEVWYFNAPIYAAVWRGEARSFKHQRLSIARNGHAEDAWFDLAYSPLRNESGAVAGVLVTVVEVSGNVRASDALQASEDRLRTVLESTTDAVLVLDRDWRVVFQNRRAKALIGGGRDLTGANLWAAFPRSEGSRFWHEYHRAMREQKPVEFTASLSESGPYFEIHAHPSPDLLTIFFRDVTEQRRGEAALRHSEELARRHLEEIEAVYATAPVGLAVFDTELRYVRVNARFAEMDGAPVEAHIGRHARDIVPDLFGQAEVLLRRVLETGEPVLNVEIVGETPAQPGVRRFWDESWFPLRAADGRIVGINVVAEEITERKRAEAALRESEHRLKLAIEAAGMGIWSLDLGSGIEQFDERVAAMLGLPPVATEMAFEEVKRLIHPDDRDRVMEAFAASVRSGEPYNAECRIIRRDGSERWFHNLGNVLRDADGVPVRVVGIAQDITDRKRAERRLKLLAREVDHRAKNMLALVQAMVRMTRAGTVPDFTRAVTGRIGALARAHTLLAQNRWEGADLQRLVSEELAPYAGDRSRARIAGPPVALLPGTAQSLAMVVHELATNAAKHGALSASRGQVAVEWSWAGRQVVLRWAEQGGPAVSPPAQHGLGTGLIERTVRDQLDGSICFAWHPGGLVCEIAIPADKLGRVRQAV